MDSSSAGAHRVWARRAKAVLALALGVYCALSLTTPVMAAPAATITLRTAAEQGAAPKWQQQGHPLHSGFCADLITALNRLDLGLHIELRAQALPQKRLMQHVQSGELDLLCALTRTADREKSFAFVQPELYNMPYVLLARADDPVEVRSWDALRTLGEQGLVLLNHDSSRVPVLQQMGGLHLHAHGLNTEANLRMLLAGRGRFFYFPLSNAWHSARMLGLEKRIRVLLPALQHEPYYLLARRDLPPEAMERLNLSLLQLRQQGELARLAMKWFGADLPAELRQALPQP